MDSKASTRAMMAPNVVSLFYFKAYLLHLIPISVANASVIDHRVMQLVQLNSGSMDLLVQLRRLTNTNELNHAIVLRYLSICFGYLVHPTVSKCHLYQAWFI